MEKGFQHHRRRVAVITLKVQRVMRAELAGEQALGKGGEGTRLHCTGISDLAVIDKRKMKKLAILYLAESALRQSVP